MWNIMKVTLLPSLCSSAVMEFRLSEEEQMLEKSVECQSQDYLHFFGPKVVGENQEFYLITVDATKVRVSPFEPHHNIVAKKSFPPPHMVGIGVALFVIIAGLMLSSIIIALSGIVLLATTFTALWELWHRRAR